MEVRNVVACQNILGEGPLWHPEEKAIYWVDINGQKIQRFFPETDKYESFNVPKKVCVIAFRNRGGVVCGAEDGFYFWESTIGNMEFISHPEKNKPEARFNDGKVDRKGRFWAGTMTFQGATSSLYRLDNDLSVHIMDSGITISNGVGWSPDNRTMYFVDSMRYVIYSYDFDFESGNIKNRKDFIQLDESVGIPDGMTVDGEGFIWCAIYDGWKVIRFDPFGKAVDEIRMPVSKPSSVMFGGKDLDELYITSIADGLSVEEKNRQPMAGDLFMIKPGVKGIVEPKFAG